jgi:hypothetical protein
MPKWTDTLQDNRAKMRAIQLALSMGKVSPFVATSRVLGFFLYLAQG